MFNTKNTEMKYLMIFICALLMIASSIYFHCLAGQDSAKSFLEEKGYTQVIVSSGDMFSCSENERSTRFTARDPGDKAVSGVVCNPVFLNPSIRLD